MPKKLPLKDYLFVENAVLDNYLDQMPPKREWKAGYSWNASLSLLGPKFEVRRDVTNVTESSNEKVYRLIEFLTSTKQIAFRRPYGEADPRGKRQFFLERMKATKVILPRERTPSIPGVTDFAVWISDPDPNDFSDEKWDWNGSFLYLTESYGPDSASRAMFSGCSALQALINVYNGKPLTQTNWDEPLGRKSSDHPIQKLAALGGLVSVPQQIEALYTVRYMIDEQCFMFDGKERRVHDIFAYPVYIARV